MKDRRIMWSIERRLVTRVNQHALTLTRRLYKQRYPDTNYNSLLTDIIETAITDIIYQTAKYGMVDYNDDDLLNAVREIGMAVIDMHGFGAVATTIELIHGRYGLSSVKIEDMYFSLLDEIFEHFTSKIFKELIMDSIVRKLPRILMDGIRDDICLLSYNINEPFIRMRFIYG